jgi:endonuclease G, mitochondrial
MKFLIPFILLPFFLTAQSTKQLLISAEINLQQISKSRDSLLTAIEDLKFINLKEDLTATGLPKLKTGEKVIFHKAYALVYNEQYEQASWVAHIILPDVVNGNESRSNDFRPDDSVTTGSAVEEDYFKRILQPDSTFKFEGFGYDRGHLAPSADFRYSKRALSESYLYSNMSPQKADFNRGRWAELEDVIRQYVVRNGHQVFVVSGGILQPNLPKIEKGKNKISIPEKYFKVCYDAVTQKGIAFIMPNKLCENPIAFYACSIDSIEALTGFDFFSNLPDAIEDGIEKKFDVQKWVSDRELGDIVPLNAETLPRNTFNTIQAQYYMGKNENIKVCGTVVSTKLSGKGNIFINLDKKFPNQIFSVTIFKDNVPNFSYQPHTFLAGKQICVTGKVTNYNGTPTMDVINENAITITENNQ